MRARSLLPLVGALFLCGCSMQEVEERTPIAAAAVDANRSGVRLTAQEVAVSSEDSVPMTKLRTAQAASLEEGLDAFGSTAFWITADTVLLSSDAAQQADSIIRTLTDEQNIRPSVRLCVVRGGSGQAVLKQEETADGLSDLLDQAVSDGQAVDEPLYRALDDSRTDGVDLALPAVQVEQDSVRAAGRALFSDNVPVGWLSQRQTEILALLRGDTKIGTLYVDGTGISLQRASVRWTVRQEEGTLRAEVRIRARLPDSSAERQKQAVRELISRSQDTISTLQASGSDALGLGRIWYRQQPKQYDAETWRARYDALPIQIRVELTPTQGGQRR